VPIDHSVKFGLLCFVAAIVLMTIHVAVHGRRLAAAKARDGSYSLPALRSHRLGVDGLLIIIVLFVVTVEFAVRASHITYSSLMWVHLPFALAWVAIFAAIRARFTGLHNRPMHRRLVYAGIGCALLAGALGVIMLINA
jgi:hypothetical protein